MKLNHKKTACKFFFCFKRKKTALAYLSYIYKQAFLQLQLQLQLPFLFSKLINYIFVFNYKYNIYNALKILIYSRAEVEGINIFIYIYLSRYQKEILFDKIFGVVLLLLFSFFFQIFISRYPINIAFVINISLLTNRQILLCLLLLLLAYLLFLLPCILLCLPPKRPPPTFHPSR